MTTSSRRHLTNFRIARRPGLRDIAVRAKGAAAERPGRERLDEPRQDPLLSAYLERREELVGYFRLRLRSEEAARDLVQEIYLKIAARPPGDVGNPVAYLYRTGTNLMLDQMKVRRRAEQRDAQWREASGETLGGLDVAAAPSAERTLAARQQLAQVMRAIDDLPPQVREAFRLHKIEGLSHAETAAAMGVSRSSVEKYLMACLRAIQQRLGGAER
jgi:RNA polymerase sigma-70 factor (ECF subfamily)